MARQEPPPRTSGRLAEDASPAGILARIRAALPSLAPSERRVAEAVLGDPGQASELSISALGERAATSVATVMRFCRAVGVSNYPQLRLALAAAAAHERARGNERPVPGTDIGAADTLADIIDKIVYTEVRALEDTGSGLDVDVLSRAVDAVAKGRRIDIFGVGASAFVGQDLHQKLACHVGVAGADDDVGGGPPAGEPVQGGQRASGRGGRRGAHPVGHHHAEPAGGRQCPGGHQPGVRPGTRLHDEGAVQPVLLVLPGTAGYEFRVGVAVARGRGSAGGGRAEPGQGVQDPGPAGQDLGRQGHVQPPGVEQPGERGRGGAGQRYGASGLMLQTSGRERARNQVAPLLEPPSDDTPAEGSLSRCQEIEPTGVLRGYHALVEPAAIGLAVEVLGLHQSHQGRRCVLRRLRQGGRGNAEVVQAERPYGIPATCCACSPPL
ncbi:HTH-type transcriptional regulator MurR [Streptomyces antimycoticus]